MTGSKENIARHLPNMAGAQPDALAVVIQGKRRADGTYGYDEYSAQDLEDESNRLARGLKKIGIGRGTRTVLMVTPSYEFFSLTFALFKLGAVPVMVDPGMGIKNLGACLAEAEPQAFIGIPKAQAARVLLRWARGSVRSVVTVGRRWFWGGHTMMGIRDVDASPVLADTRADEMAAILFTSGSTGVPKGAVYTHGIFEAQVCVLRDDYGVAPGERDLATFPLFALFGPALGMAAIVPDMDASRPITADPRNIIAAIHDFEATNLFASPALIRKVGEYGAAHGARLPSIRRVISAGAPADPESLVQFSSMLNSDAAVLPSYGATEALPVSFIDAKELIEDTAERTAQGGGVCVGRPVAGVDIRIIKISNGSMPVWSEDLLVQPGRIGEICVCGPMVTAEYYGKVGATELAKIRVPGSDRFYHRMGDVGYFDDAGRLWFCGRKSHRVEERDQVRFTIPCERIFNAHPKVRRTALVGISRIGKHVPVMCVELEPDAGEVNVEALTKELLELGDRFPETRGIDEFLVHSGFPVDVRHNAKIFREQLALWAKDRLA